MAFIRGSALRNTEHGLRNTGTSGAKEKFMQGIRLENWKVEVAIPNLLIKATLQPRGDLMIFLNNLTYTSFTFNDVELVPLGTDYQVKGVKQPMMNVTRNAISFMSVLEPEKATQIQLLQSKRLMVFYTEMVCRARRFARQYRNPGRKPVR
jgi:hypothetical protein